MAERHPWIRGLEVAVPAAVLLLHVLGSATSAGPGPLRFALGVIALFILPGYLLGRRIWALGRWNGLEWFCLSTCLSLGLGCLAAWALYVLHVHAGALVFVLGALAVLLLVPLGRLPARSPADPLRTAEEAHARWFLAAAGLAGLVALVLLLSPPRFGYGEDALGHIAVTRVIAETGEVIPLEQFYADQGRSHEDPRVGLLHPVIAALGRASGVEMYDVWRWLRVPFSFFWISSFFLFATAILRDARKGFLAAVLFVFLFGGHAQGANALTTGVIYPSRIGMGVFWTGVALVLRHGRTPGRDLFWMSALCLPTGAMIHVTPFLQLWITLAVLGTLLLVLARDRRAYAVEVWKILGVGTALSLPYLLMRFAAAYDVSNPIHRAPMQVLFLGRGWMLPNPLLILDTFSLPGLLAIPLGLALGRRGRKDPGVLLLFGNTLAGVLLLAVPPFFTAAFKTLNFLAVRFTLLVPFVTILTLYVTDALSAWTRAGTLRARAGALLFVLFVALLALPAVSIHAEYLVGPFLHPEAPEDPTELRPVLRALDRASPEPSVVLADPYTSYAVLAFTHHRVIAMPPGHSSPGDSLSVERIYDLTTALRPATPLRESLEIMRRYGVDYILLNHTFSQTHNDYAFSIDPGRFAQEKARLDAHPGFFEPVAAEGRAYLYRLRVPPDSLASLPEATPRLPGCEEVPPLPTPALFEGLFRLVGGEVDPGEVTRGGRVNIRCWWQRVAQPVHDQDYRFHVRFDRDFARGPLWNEAYSKPYRRLLERLRGERYRFRVVRAPAESLPPPSRWPLGVTLADSFQVQIPENLTPGRYEVKVALRPKDIHPNLYLTDLLRDRDRMDGARIGWLDVR